MDSQHARTFTTHMNDTVFKLLERFQIRVYLQTCRLQIWWTGNFANLFLFPHCCIYLFWHVLCIAQKIKVSECIECIYCCRYPFLSLKNCLWIKMSAFGRKRGGFLQSLTILNLLSSQFIVVQRESMLSGTLRLFVPPGGIFLKENYQGVELPLSLIITWGIFSVLNITKLSVDSLLRQAI